MKDEVFFGLIPFLDVDETVFDVHWNQPPSHKLPRFGFVLSSRVVIYIGKDKHCLFLPMGQRKCR